MLGRIPEPLWRFGVPSIFVASLLPRLASHAFWFDEAQAWLISRHSASLQDLLQILRFEGHPPLWYLILWPFAHATASPEWMKVPTALSAAWAACLIPRVRALQRIEHLLLFTGFTTLVGYTTISRPYILGVALVLLYLVVAQKHRGPTSELATLGLLILTHLLFAIVAAALYIATVNRYRSPGSWFAKGWTRPARFLAILLPILGVWVATFALNPNAWGVAQALHLRSAARVIGAAILPLGEFTLTRDALGFGTVVWSAAVSVAYVLIGLLIFSIARSRIARPLALAAVGLLINALIGYGHEWWHLGIFVWTLVAGTVLSRSQDPPTSVPLAALRDSSFRILLALPVVASVLWILSPLSALPYSPDREAAAAIRKACPTGCPLVTDKNAYTAVSAYLGGKPIYVMSIGASQTYTSHDVRIRFKTVTWDSLRLQLRLRGPDSLAFLYVLRNPPSDFEVLATTAESAVAVTRADNLLAPTDIILVRLRRS